MGDSNPRPNDRQRDSLKISEKTTEHFPVEQSPSETCTADRVVVFSDDWGRHPSSCQHLIRHLLDQHQVTWVNTIGMRPPRFDRTTVKRAIEKVFHWSPGNGVPDTNVSSRQVEPVILNPKMWPWFRTSLDRGVNKRLLCSQLAEHFSEETVAITTIPIVADIMDCLPVQRWVYYCVDDFSEWPGLDQLSMRRLEDAVIAKADVLIAASASLQTRLSQMGRESQLITHGVDLNHWSEGETIGMTASRFTQLEHPLIVFWGVIDQRLDVEYLKALDQTMDRGTILLVGPQQNPPPEIFQLKRVQIEPAIDFHELPSLGRAADVLIMPYVDQPVTRAMQPLKLLEYLATGKPVVVRSLPATTPWADALEVAASVESFVSAVERALSQGVTENQIVARERLRFESWSAKASVFREAFLQSSQLNS